jgi:hypothetical protein
MFYLLKLNFLHCGRAGGGFNRAEISAQGRNHQTLNGVSRGK